MEVYATTLTRLLVALIAGALIGLERTRHGRPAGFRTHILVCTASALLMLVTVYQLQLLEDFLHDTLRVDPTRMAQGIMTGIGFLGAGVIMKEGLSVRGLTTAASIWMTASIGILVGLGFFFPAAVATLLTLGTLSVFRWVESVIPTLHYARLELKTARQQPLDHAKLQELIQNHDITTADNASFLVSDSGKTAVTRLTVRTKNPDTFRKLANTLAEMDAIIEFALIPAGESK